MIEIGFELAAGIYMFVVVFSFLGWLLFVCVAGLFHTDPKPETIIARGRRHIERPYLPTDTTPAIYDPWVTYRCGCVRREQEWFRRCKLHSRIEPGEKLREA